MKFTFKRLGTLKRASFELKPLTAIIGPNNSSKTYLSYAVYGLLQTLRQWYDTPASDHFIENKQHVLNAELVASVSEFVSTRFQDTRAVFFQHVGDSPNDPILGSQLELRLSLGEAAQAFERAFDRMERLDRWRAQLQREPEGSLRFHIQAAQEEGASHVTGEAAQRPNEPLQAMIFVAIFGTSLARLSGTPLFLPAERNALILTHRLLSTRRLRALRDGQRLRLDSLGPRLPFSDAEELAAGEIRYPQPIEDFLDFLSDLELKTPDITRRLQDEATRPLVALADTLESVMGEGIRVHYHTNPVGGRELRLELKRKRHLGLHNASSSIKQLIPLLLFLRYHARPGHVLMIDEPEMNLHPATQARVLEILAIMVRLGVKVVFTTHSPYLMSHLNNLIAADRKNPARARAQAEKLYLQDERAFLSPEEVGAFELKAGILRDLFDKDYGIRWDTLGDVASELQATYYAIRALEEEEQLDTPPASTSPTPTQEDGPEEEHEEGST
ncbi:MAG: AAA family ATPase [Myxococcota bacterium]